MVVTVVIVIHVKYCFNNRYLHIPSWRMSHIAVLQVASAVPIYDTGKCFPTPAVCLLNAESKTYFHIRIIKDKLFFCFCFGCQKFDKFISINRASQILCTAIDGCCLRSWLAYLPASGASYWRCSQTLTLLFQLSFWVDGHMHRHTFAKRRH